MTAFDTSFCRLFGIEIPIVQAPIGGQSTPALAAAVSNAGGLGTLSGTWREPQGLRDLIAETHRLTERPFGVNLVLAWPPDERLSICLDGGVRLISFSFGDSSPYIKQVHDAGSLVCQMVGSAAEARRAVDAGVDVIVAQGWEAGGHVSGQVSTLALVPRVVDTVTPIPVLAAGGIADGRGLAAVLTLGAAGAWMGTRFLFSEEASTHPDYLARLAGASETDTAYSELFDVDWPNAPLRALRNSTHNAWEAAGCPVTGQRPGEGEIIGANELGDPVPRYSSSSPVIGATGEIEAMALYAGQGVGLVNRQQPAGKIVRDIANEAARVLDRTRGRIRSDVTVGIGQ